MRGREVKNVPPPCHFLSLCAACQSRQVLCSLQIFCSVFVLIVTTLTSRLVTSVKLTLQLFPGLAGGCRERQGSVLQCCGAVQWRHVHTWHASSVSARSAFLRRADLCHRFLAAGSSLAPGAGSKLSFRGPPRPCNSDMQGRSFKGKVLPLVAALLVLARVSNGEHLGNASCANDDDQALLQARVKTPCSPDATPPVPVVPADIEVDNDPGECFAVVTYAPPTATDECDWALVKECN